MFIFVVFLHRKNVHRSIYNKPINENRLFQA